MIKRPSPFVLVASGHGTLITNHNDICVASDGQAYGVGHQLLQTSYFDPEEVGVVLALLGFRREFFGDGVVALDCGANIGVHTVEWAKAMHGWGSVLAIEAQERIFYALAGNIAINNCFNARALHAAVGAAVGELSIPVPDYTRRSSFGSLELKWNNNAEFIGQTISYAEADCQKTRLLSIDSLGLKRIDFIKLDIEGMEMEALKGAEQSIRACKPQMLVEWIKTDKQVLWGVLESYGYRIYEVGINFLAVHESDSSNARIT